MPSYQRPFSDSPDGVVVKPVRGSGGRRVARVPAHRVDLLDLALSNARTGSHVVIQRYLAGASRGEKRLIWADGQIVGGYLRQRSPGDFRHNLKQGASAHPVNIEENDWIAVAALTPHLIKLGVRFAGLDLIDHHITDVNVLNPGGTVQIAVQSGQGAADTVIASLEKPAPTATELAKWASPAS